MWSDISTHVYTRLHTERSRKRRLITLLRAFREAATALPDGVVVLTKGRSILWFNEAATRLLGLSAPRDRRAHVDPFLPPLAKAWITQEPALEPLREVPSSRDESLRLSFRLIPYSPEHMLLVVRDVTPLARLEQVRRDFVANVSHELRTPLTVLHGYLEMIEPEVTPELGPILADLRGQSRRMTQIVEDLLTLSRLEAQQQPAQDRVPMRVLLNSLQREAEGLSQGRHTINLMRTCEADLRGSTDYLHSAFSNLVSNARALHPGRRPYRDFVAGQHRRRALCRRRYRLWHSSRTSAPHHRALLPRVDQPFARDRRHWTRTVDRQACAATARGPAGHRKPRSASAARSAPYSTVSACWRRRRRPRMPDHRDEAMVWL